MSMMPPEPTPSTDPTTPPPAAPAAPPWGEDFDPERAWRLVENLRAENGQLKQRPRLTAEEQQALDDYNSLVEASQTDAERRERELAQYRSRVDELDPKATRLEVALDHGIPKDFLDLLGSGTREEIEARAERVKTLIAGQAPVTPPAVPAPGNRPVAQLRPGATPSQQPDSEDAAYERLFPQR